MGFAGPSSQAATTHLTLEEFQPVMNSAMQLGAAQIKITGGEPFVHPQMLKLVGLASSLFRQVTVETNETLLEAKSIKLLSELRNVHLNVSLDGATSETHSLLRRDPRAFARTVRNLR